MVDSNNGNAANLTWHKTATGTQTVLQAAVINIPAATFWTASVPHPVQTDDTVSGFVTYISTTNVGPNAVL
jgi:hypothetical protein